MNDPHWSVYIISHVMFLKGILGLLLLTAASLGHRQVNTYQEIAIEYENLSYFPILHMHFNTHFSQSAQFEEFLDTIESLEEKTQDYGRIMLTDCSNVEASKIWLIQRKNKRYRHAH